MNDTRTASILARVPVILAVTAASYGLPSKAGHGQRAAGGDKPTHMREAGPSRREPVTH